MLRKGHGGLYIAPTQEERSERLRGDEDQITFIAFRFEKGRVEGFGQEEEGKALY